MKYKLSAPNRKITFDDGGHDLFGRSQFGKFLCSLVSETTDPLVISLEAPWGEGKTSFIYKWQHQLKECNIPNLYIDAYAHDFQSDPLTVIAAELYEEIQRLDVDKKLKQSTLDNFKKAVTAISKGFFKAAVKTAVKSIIDEKGLEDIEKALSKELEGLADQKSADVLDEYKKRKAIMISLKSSLKEITDAVASQSDGKPMVVVIDELDRCRPTFALDLLETVKHLFDTANICFVIVNNPHQLQESIKAVYGAGIDARSYLIKFYDLSFNLPQSSNPRREDHSIQMFATMALNQLFGSAHESNYLSNYLDYLPNLKRRLGLSLRDIEKVCILLTFIETFNHHSNYPLDEYNYIIFMTLAGLAVKKPELLRPLRDNSCEWDQMKSALQLPELRENFAIRPEEIFWRAYYGQLPSHHTAGINLTGISQHGPSAIHDTAALFLNCNLD